MYKKCTDFPEITYSGVFGVADSDSCIRFSKINMAVPIWRQQNEEIKYIRLKHIASLSDLLDTHYAVVYRVADYESEIRFSKFKMADPIWRTQFKNCLVLSEIHYSGVLGVADYESGIRF